MTKKNKIILMFFIVTPLLAWIWNSNDKFDNKLSFKDVNHSQCITVDKNAKVSFYKKYADKLKNHPSFIERNFDAKAMAFHQEYNYYNIKEINDHFLLLSNKYDEDFQIKISNQKNNFKYKECVTQKLNYTAGSCLEYTNIRNGSKSFWKVENEDAENYLISGIYNSSLTNKIVQDGQLNKVFQHYNPDLTFPLKIGKFQINQSSKSVVCPMKITTHLNLNDCVKYKNMKLKIINKNKEYGVFETKILEQGSSFSRLPASISEDLDKIISDIEKEKIKHGWKDLYFLDQDVAQLTDCK